MKVWRSHPPSQNNHQYLAKSYQIIMTKKSSHHVIECTIIIHTFWFWEFQKVKTKRIETKIIFYYVNLGLPMTHMTSAV